MDDLPAPRSSTTSPSASACPACPTSWTATTSSPTYEELTGHTVAHLEWFEVLAALRFAIVSVRTSTRGIAYGAHGEARRPRRPDHVPRPAGTDARRHVLGLEPGIRALASRTPGRRVGLQAVAERVLDCLARRRRAPRRRVARGVYVWCAFASIAWRPPLSWPISILRGRDRSDMGMVTFRTPLS